MNLSYLYFKKLEMEIITRRPPTEQIMVEDITTEYIVVAVINGNPCILNKGCDEPVKNTSFKILCNGFTQGACYSSDQAVSVHELPQIRFYYEKGYKIEAFHQDNWQEALQWLIDNG